MENLIINQWIFDNQPLYKVNIGDDLNLSLTKIENPILFGEENYGYYYLSNGFRFGFSENKIDEIGIDFSQSKSKILLLEEGNSFNLTESKIHEVLNHLNEKLISWESVVTKDVNYLVIKLLKTKIHFIFDVYTGKLDRIGKTNVQV